MQSEGTESTKGVFVLTEPVFFRLWEAVEDRKRYPDTMDDVEFNCGVDEALSVIEDFFEVV